NGHLDLADLHRQAGRAAEAGKEDGAGLARVEQMARDFPAETLDAKVIHAAHDALAALLARAPQHPEPEPLPPRAGAFFPKVSAARPKVPDYRQRLAAWHYQLGVLCNETGRLAEAEKEYRAALPIHEKLAVEYPKQSSLRYNLCVTRCFLARLLRDTGRPG